MFAAFLHAILIFSAMAADFYTVPAGSTLEITEHSVCHGVSNGLTQDLFVPTRTAGEWSSFYNNTPTGVSLSACSSDWYDPAWGYRIRIVVSPSQVDGTQNDFPVLITQANLPGSFFSNVKADGTDIVVTASDGITALSRDLERINTGASLMELWVRVPSLSDSNPTVLFLYYGNPAGAESNSTATWSAFRNVYHMTTTTPSDAAGLTATSGVTGGTVVAGQVGQGLSYNGSGRVNFSTSIAGGGLRTISFWYYPRSRGGGNFGTVFGSNGYPNGIRHVGTDPINIRRSNAVVVSSSSTFNVWKHLVFSYDSGSGQVTLYENGVAGTATSLPGGWFDLHHLISIAGDTNRAPDGIVDEMRIATTTKSAQWVSTEYRSQSSPATFYSAGPEVPRP